MENTVHLPFFCTPPQSSTYSYCWRQVNEIFGFIQNCDPSDDDYDGVSNLWSSQYSGKKNPESLTIHLEHCTIEIKK